MCELQLVLEDHRIAVGLLRAVWRRRASHRRALLARRLRRLHLVATSVVAVATVLRIVRAFLRRAMTT